MKTKTYRWLLNNEQLGRVLAQATLAARDVEVADGAHLTVQVSHIVVNNQVEHTRVEVEVMSPDAAVESETEGA